MEYLKLPFYQESYASVEAFASRASASLARIYAVVANAGIMTTKLGLAEGNEKTLTVNVVSVFLLFFLLLPKLRQSPFPGTFVIPNSAMHYWAPLKELLPQSGSTIFSRLNDPGSASMGARYTKLLVYAMRELAARTAASGKGAVIINAPNPSYCKSDLASELKEPPDFLARSTEMGSRALVHGLTASPASNGRYLTNCHIQTPASHVINKTCAQIQEAFFTELMERPESISPGITGNV